MSATVARFRTHGPTGVALSLALVALLEPTAFSLLLAGVVGSFLSILWLDVISKGQRGYRFAVTGLWVSLLWLTLTIVLVLVGHIPS